MNGYREFKGKLVEVRKSLFKDFYFDGDIEYECI